MNNFASVNLFARCKLTRTFNIKQSIKALYLTQVFLYIPDIFSGVFSVITYTNLSFPLKTFR
jgi:hypothetical protein